MLKSVSGIARLLYAFTLKSLNATACILQPAPTIEEKATNEKNRT